MAAILVGMIVRFFNKHVFWLDRLLERAARPGAMREPLPSAETAAYAPDAPLVISIDREYGSGGHAIGAMIAEPARHPILRLGTGVPHCGAKRPHAGLHPQA